VTIVITDLVIPAFNERANIDALFDALDALPEGLIRYIVLADNNSTDGTGDAAAARGAVVVHEARPGYGSACLRAMQWIAQQESPPVALAFLDADLSDDPAALADVLQPIRADGARIVIGSRVRHAQPGALNVVQKFGNSLACTLMWICTGRMYTDLGPLRAVRWDLLPALNMADPDWGWTIEMQMKAALLGIPVVEVDVPYRRRHAGTSKISGTIRGVWKAGRKILLTIWILWWRRARIRADAAASPPLVPDKIG
jgi:glycosyltransferase involved in cell wall biosynthesis